MTRSVNLPMYNFPAMRLANAALWHALAGVLRQDGFEDLPDEVDAAAPVIPDRIAPDVLFTQTCGYPLLMRYAGQFQVLATPAYRAPGCAGMTHSAFFIVREDDAARHLEDLRGRRFAVNSLHSNSGMNLPRRAIAPLARDGRFFGEVIFSGSHPASLTLLGQGRVDAVSVDCLTWAFAKDQAPELVAGLRVLAQTPSSPAIPFITGLATPPDLVAALRRALLIVGADPAFAAVRTGLGLDSIGWLDLKAYDVLRQYEHEATAAGYPRIA